MDNKKEPRDMKKTPAIYPFLLDALDRADPTRSHELPPSERIAEAFRFRRQFRIFATCISAMVALFVIVTVLA